MKHFYEGGNAMPYLEQRRTFIIQSNLKTLLNSFQCLLLSLSTYYYQFSCNVQESRASGTTGYDDERESGDAKRSNAVLLLTIFCVLFSFASVVEAQAQKLRQGGATGQAAIKPLQIGDTIPEEIWNMPFQVVEYGGKTKEIRLADYRGKVIILDYWATWCGSCIQTLPKMHALTHHFASGVVLLPVTYENEDVVSNFLKNTGSPYIHEIKDEFETVINGSLLKELIPHQTLPHIGIINTAGVLQQVTKPPLINVLMIEEIVQNRVSSFRAYNEKLDKNILSFNFRELEKDRKSYYTALTGHIDGFINPVIEIADTIQQYRYGHYVNHTLLRLFQLALMPNFNIMLPSRRIFKLSESLTNELIEKGFYAKELCYSYEYMLPFEYPKQRIRERLKQDLEDLLPFRAVIIKRDMPCLVLRAMQSKLVKRSKSDMISGVVLDGILQTRASTYLGLSTMGKKNYMIGTNLKGLALFFNKNAKFSLPYVLDETGINYPIDLYFPDDMTDQNELISILKKQGIEVSIETKSMDMFCLTDTNGLEGDIYSTPLEFSKIGYILRKDQRSE